MERETPSDGAATEGTHSNRRRFLKGVGAATVGAVALTGTASAQQYQFDGCRQVYSDTHADIAVVATEEGFDCRSITEEVDSEAVPWDWGGYRYVAEPGEVVIGAIEEDAWQGRQVFQQWTCDLELNPSDCAGRFYESAQQVKAALNDNEDCGACAGLIVSGDGDGVTTAPDDASAANSTQAPDEASNATAATGGSETDDGSTGDGGAGEGGEGQASGDGNSDSDELDAVTSIGGVIRNYVETQFGF